MNFKTFFLIILGLPLFSYAQQVELIAKMPNPYLYVEQLIEYKGEMYIVGVGTNGSNPSTVNLLFKLNRFGKSISSFPNDTDQEKFLYAHELVKSGQYLFIRTDEEIYRTDGTKNGTIFLSNYDRDIKVIIPVKNGKVIFPVTEGEHRILKVSDGNVTGNHLLKVIDESLSSYVSDGSNAYFFSKQNDGLNYTLWKTDGTENGTFKIKTLTGGVPINLKLIGETLFFNMDNLLNGMGRYPLWKSNGTEEGTNSLSFTFSTSASVLAKSGNIFLLSGNDHEGNKLYYYDGVNAPVMISGPFVGDMIATKVAVYDNIILFIVSNDLWQTDGTREGTFMIADLASRNQVLQNIGKGFYNVERDFNDHSFYTFSYDDSIGFVQEITPAQKFSSVPANFLESPYGTYFTAHQDTTDNIWFVKNKSIVSGDIKKASDPGITIYPVPSVGAITIDAGSVGNYRIINSTGQNMYSTDNAKKININGLAPGFYIAEFSNDERFQRKTFVITE